MTLYSIVLSRVFGPEKLGTYAVFLSISAALAIVGAFGVDGALLRYLPRFSNGEQSFGTVEYKGIRHFVWHLFAFRLAVNTALIVLVVLVLGVLPAYIPSLSNSLGTIRVMVPYLAIYLLGQAIVAFSTFTLIGLLQTKWVFFSSLIARGLMLAAGGVVIATGNLTIESAAAIHSLGALLNGLLLLGWVYFKVAGTERVGVRREGQAVLRRMFEFIRSPKAVRMFVMLPFMLYGITTWGNDVLSTVLGRQPDILMMRAILGENARDIGLYHSAAQLVLMTEYVFLFGFGGALVSVFSELAHDDEKRTERRSYPRLAQARKDVAGFQSVTTAPLFGFMMVFAPLVIEAVYGPKFLDAAPLVVASLVILSCGVVIFGGGMHITSLVAVGKERWVFGNRLGWGVLNLVLNYFLITYYGGIGAMVGTQVCNTGACITEGWYARRFIGPAMSAQRVVPILAVASASVALAYGVLSFVPISVPALVRLAIAGLVTLAFCLTGYVVFKLPDARRVLEKARHIVIKKSTSAGVPTTVA